MSNKKQLQKLQLFWISKGNLQYEKDTISVDANRNHSTVA